MYTPVLIEYLGTCLIIGTAAFTSSPLFIIAAVAVAIGLGGKISGGYFNPAVTAWALTSGKINNSKALMYWIAQFGAGLTIWILGSMIKA
jgi:glycerol uptake facilitator-like aquaporin